MGSREGTVVKELASHQCVPCLIPGPGVNGAIAHNQPQVASDCTKMACFTKKLNFNKSRFLVGCGKKSNFAGLSGTNSLKNGGFHRNFGGIFEASFAEKLLVKKG